LVYLLDLLSQKAVLAEDIYDKAILLNGFSVQIRYPDTNIYLSKEELEASISITQVIRDLAIKIVELKD
jgi:hypothetical protein